MNAPYRALIAFGRDDDVAVFRSLDEASGWMEAPDVDAGEYVALFTDSGIVVHASTEADRVVLTITDERVETGLRARIREYQRRTGASESEDPLEFARHELHREWQQRWPRRPQWLARRVHGDRPPEI